MIREMERPRSRHDSEIHMRRGYSKGPLAIEFRIFSVTSFDQLVIVIVCKRMTRELLDRCFFFGIHDVMTAVLRHEVYTRTRCKHLGE